MSSIFLYQQWLHRRLHAFINAPRPIALQGRKITLSPEQYGAALMQAYLGKQSLKWIAKQANISLDHLKQWRRQPQFLLVMDWSKPIFAEDFYEKLVLNDYAVEQYHSISGEVALLETSLRVVVRMPLYRRFSDLGQRLISRHRNDLALDSYDLRLFRRLFLFFWSLEHHWPGPAGKALEEDFVPLAKEVVWPFLDQVEWIGPSLTAIQRAVPPSRIRRLLGIQLKETLDLQNPGEKFS